MIVCLDIYYFCLLLGPLLAREFSFLCLTVFTVIFCLPAHIYVSLYIYSSVSLNEMSVSTYMISTFYYSSFKLASAHSCAPLSFQLNNACLLTIVLRCLFTHLFVCLFIDRLSRHVRFLPLTFLTSIIRSFCSCLSYTNTLIHSLSLKYSLSLSIILIFIPPDL